MPRKTPAEIDAEVERLDDLLGRLPRHTHERVEAERAVLADRMSHDDVYDAWGDESADEFDQELLDAAVQAHLWMTGINTGPAPSEGWESLARPRTGKLIATGEAKRAAKPLTKPCTDCPMARASLNGWLGGATPEEYRRLAHSDARVECHVHGHRCAGMAIYRTNVCKGQPAEDKLPADHEAVFSTPMQFLDHHNSLPTPKGA